MEDTDTTTTNADWRQAWRSFAAGMRPKIEGDRHEPVRVAVRVRSDEAEGESFRGFRSPPGKF